MHLMGGGRESQHDSILKAVSKLAKQYIQNLALYNQQC